MSARPRLWIGVTSLLFAVLQSVCTLFMAMAGLRLLVGVSSLVLSTGAVAMLDHLHADWLRVPMICLATIGAVLNVAAILQLRALRRRPASQWRLSPPTPHKLRMERLQLILSWLTLVLVVMEESFHFHLCHHF